MRSPSWLGRSAVRCALVSQICVQLLTQQEKSGRVGHIRQAFEQRPNGCVLTITNRRDHTSDELLGHRRHRLAVNIHRLRLPP
ncbi:hypothetical protein [Streptomyces venezuelae]|uniref:hypothetical protein n=1 Tax=Streptomyces venezuelae TaxID=54571 RepID=UPI003420CDA5